MAKVLILGEDRQRLRYRNHGNGGRSFDHTSARWRVTFDGLFAFLCPVRLAGRPSTCG